MSRLFKCSLNANRSGMTLVEIMVASVIILVVIVGIVQLHYFCQTVGNYGKNLLYSMTAAQSKMEAIRAHSYDSIATDFGAGGTPGNTFNLSNLTGKGIISVDSSNSDLLVVTIAVSFQNANGRVIGPDIDFDGVQDAGESNILESSVKLVSYIARR